MMGRCAKLLVVIQQRLLVRRVLDFAKDARGGSERVVAILEHGLQDQLVHLHDREQAIHQGHPTHARVDEHGLGVERQGHRFVEAFGHLGPLHRVDLLAGLGQGHDARGRIKNHGARGTEGNHREG